MALHLIKLSVGSESVSSLAEWQAKHRTANGVAWHGTRMAPKRKDELLAGGSIYWVIQGLIQARQELRDIVPVVRDDGHAGGAVCFCPAAYSCGSASVSCFSGWRYFASEEAPPDLDEAAVKATATGKAVPSQQETNPQILRELRDMGLL